MLRKLWCLVLFVPAAAAGCNTSPAALPSPKPPEVVVSRAVLRTVTDYEEFQGKTDAEKTVDLKARVSGYLDKVYVGREDETVDGHKPPIREGSDVKRGQILYVIQEKPFQDALNQARGNLKSLQAQRDNNKRAKDRLDSSGAGTSPNDLDTADTAYRMSVEQVASATAAVEIAKQNLEWATIRAPFDGRIGRRMIDLGNVVKADDTVLTRIVSLEPIYAYFDVDERTYLRIQHVLEKNGVSANQMRDKPVEMGLADEKAEFPHKGRIDFTDNRVDPDSGSVWLRGVFDNPNEFLTPGLFVRVRLPVGEPHSSVLIPEQALTTDQGQKHVWVVDDQGHATYRQVELGAQHGTLRVVDKGIQEGERVIVNGLQKVRNDPEKHYAEVHVTRED